MVVVVDANERLDLRSFRRFLLSHLSRDFERVAIDSRDECVSVRSTLVTVVLVLHYDRLFAGVAAREH